MKGWMKALFGVSIGLALVFGYVVLRQDKLDKEIQVQEAQFDRDWARGMGEISRSEKMKKVYAKEEEEAEIKLKKAEAELAIKQKVADKNVTAVKEAIDDGDKK